MFIEIDTTDLIAFLIKKSDFFDFIQIPFSKVFYLDKPLESENEDILLSCDVFSPQMLLLRNQLSRLLKRIKYAML